jgi:hydrogenase maturation protease
MTNPLRKPLAVIGVGNVLFGDDGFGVRVVWALQGDPPPGADLIDGGSIGLSLLDFLTEYRRIILVDAADMHLPAGTLTAFSDDEVHSLIRDDRLSLHSADVLGVIDLAKVLGIAVADVTIIAVQPGFIGPQGSLSEAVEIALPSAVEAVRRLVDELRRQ